MLKSLHTVSPHTPAANAHRASEVAHFVSAVKGRTDTLFSRPILAPDGRVILALTLPAGSVLALAESLPRDGALLVPLPAESQAARDLRAALVQESLHRMEHQFSMVYLMDTTWIMGRVIGHSAAQPFQQPRPRPEGGWLAIGGVISEQLRDANGDTSNRFQQHTVMSLACPSTTHIVALKATRDRTTRHATKVELIALSPGESITAPDPTVFISPLWTNTRNGWIPHPAAFPTPGRPHGSANITGTLL